MLRLLLDTGVRVSELCGLELTDLDLHRELAHVIGKGCLPVRALHPHARSRGRCSASAAR